MFSGLRGLKVLSVKMRLFAKGREPMKTEGSGKKGAQKSIK